MIGLSVQSGNCSPVNPTRLITGHSILTIFCRNKFKHLMAANDYKEIKTCGIVVIGDEILKAQVEDTNSRFLQTQGIDQLVQRYRNGIRGRMKSAVHELLRQYYGVESQFQQVGTYLQ
uniref:Acetyl-CoA carboxylase n=1 Tax=Cacopsylla melanoneura TaxID=428564 RepID=A0A8D8LW01_9HEMI